MSYQISPNLEARVQAQISTGKFANEEEVLLEALNTLEKRERGLEELQSLVQTADEDIAAGRVGKFDIDKTLTAVRERLTRHREIQ